jgi:hypothetical protein
MAPVDLKLVQSVAIAGVRVQRSEVRVGLYGGPDNVCASVCFTFEKAAERAANVKLLRRWEKTGEPLSLLMHGNSVRLVSERALFLRAMEPAGSD